MGNLREKLEKMDVVTICELWQELCAAYPSVSGMINELVDAAEYDTDTQEYIESQVGD